MLDGPDVAWDAVEPSVVDESDAVGVLVEPSVLCAGGPSVVSDVALSVDVVADESFDVVVCVLSVPVEDEAVRSVALVDCVLALSWLLDVCDVCVSVVVSANAGEMPAIRVPKTMVAATALVFNLVIVCLLIKVVGSTKFGHKKSPTRNDSLKVTSNLAIIGISPLDPNRLCVLMLSHEFAFDNHLEASGRDTLQYAPQKEIGQYELVGKSGSYPCLQLTSETVK